MPSDEFDPLTGALSRTALLTSLTTMLDEAETSGDRLAAIAIALPDGDDQLVEATEVVQRAVRAEDLVARLGLDELAVVARIGHGGVADVRGIVTRLCERLHRSETGGARLGFALSPAHGSTADELVDHADLALHSAGARGVPMSGFQPWLLDADTHDYDVHRLWHALRDDELVVAYQPRVDLRTLQVRALQALVVSPLEPRTTPVDLRTAIASWALDRALRDTARLVDEGRLEVPVTVPVDDDTFAGSWLVPAVEDGLLHHGLEASMLQVAVCCGPAADLVPAWMDNLGDLQRLGAQVVLGGVGRDYASLRRIKDRLFHAVVIDAALVGRLPGDGTAREIVKGIVTLARADGVPVIADGVASPECHDLLRSLGCEYGQGARYADPMPFDELTGWLARTVRAPRARTSRSVGYQPPSAWHPPVLR